MKLWAECFGTLLYTIVVNCWASKGQYSSRATVDSATVEKMQVDSSMHEHLRFPNVLFPLRCTSVARCKPLLTMGECVSAYFILDTVLPSTAHSLLHLLERTALPRYRATRIDYCTSLRQCLLALLSQLLLSLKLLPQLHSCRSSIVRVKRYSYRFVRQSFS
jgi:hypothetical protein